MMLPWVNAIVNGRKDLAFLMVNDRWAKVQREAFDQVQCLEESNGVEAIGGIACLFAPMPHVCIFRTLKVGMYNTVKTGRSMMSINDGCSFYTTNEIPITSVGCAEVRIPLYLLTLPTFHFKNERPYLARALR